jgi:hypothetical protein
MARLWQLGRRASRVRGERSVEHRNAQIRNRVALDGATRAKPRFGGKLSHHVHLADRAALADAADLIARFGAYAGSEAALRAGRSRDVGNVVHFCRWRQVERMIDMLREEEATGLLH